MMHTERLGAGLSASTMRLVAELPEPVVGEDLATAVDTALGPVDALGEPWRTQPLFPGTDDAHLRRFAVVVGAVPTAPSYDLSRVGYDCAARLEDVLGVPVEPDLPSTAYGPDEVPADDDQESIGDTRGSHLPGSDDRAWVLTAVRAREAWALDPPAGGRSRGEGVLVGSVDTGYTEHPEMAGAFSFDLDRDVIDEDDDARDPLERPWYLPLASPGHGTHTGSVVASRASGTVVGVAPLATVVPIRTVTSVVQVVDGQVAQGVEAARRRGCKVITMSLGGRGFVGLRAAIRAAVDDGAVVMAAAGNQVGVVVAPAVYPECLAVAGVNVEDRPWTGSSRGDAVDISAPGESVWVASVDSAHSPPSFLVRRHHGTSFAVATLAGVAALWVAFHGHDRIVARYGRGNVQWAFLALLREHGHRVPPRWDAGRYGVGVVDAHALLAAGLPDLPTLVTEAAPGTADTVARLRAMLTGLTRDEVRAAVAGLLDLRPEQVDTLPERTVSELVYRLGEDPDLRRALSRAEETPGPGAGTGGRDLLRRTASAAMQHDIGIRPDPRRAP